MFNFISNVIHKHLFSLFFYYLFFSYHKMKLPFNIIMIIVFFMFIVFISSIQATTQQFYITTTGPNGNGSMVAPFSNLTEAAGILSNWWANTSDSFVINIASGTYLNLLFDIFFICCCSPLSLFNFILTFFLFLLRFIFQKQSILSLFHFLFIYHKHQWPLFILMLRFGKNPFTFFLSFFLFKLFFSLLN